MLYIYMIAKSPESLLGWFQEQMYSWPGNVTIQVLWNCLCCNPISTSISRKPAICYNLVCSATDHQWYLISWWLLPQHYCLFVASKAKQSKILFIWAWTTIYPDCNNFGDVRLDACVVAFGHATWDSSYFITWYSSNLITWDSSNLMHGWVVAWMHATQGCSNLITVAMSFLVCIQAGDLYPFLLKDC